MSTRFFLLMWSIKKNLTFWTAFLTRIPMIILLIFWGHLPFPNRNSYDFSSAHKYDLLLSEKADDHGICQTEFRSEFFENSGFIWFFQIEFLKLFFCWQIWTIYCQKKQMIVEFYKNSGWKSSRLILILLGNSKD